MTGDHIRRLREALGMRKDDFACFLGVHQSTLYRWESKGPGAAQPDQLRLLTALRGQVKKLGVRATAKLGQDLRAAFLAGGGLFAVFRFLCLVFADAPRPRK